MSDRQHRDLPASYSLVKCQSLAGYLGVKSKNLPNDLNEHERYTIARASFQDS